MIKAFATYGGSAPTAPEVVEMSSVASVVPGLPAQVSVLTAQTVASTTYTDLATVGPMYTITVGTTGVIEVDIQTTLTIAVGNAASPSGFMSFVLSGGASQAASDVIGIGLQPPMGASSVETGGGTIKGMFVVTGLTPGAAVTVTAKYRTSSATTGTYTFSNRYLTCATW